MAKTEKTALFRHLESKVESYFPSSASVDACVVDGSFLLRVLPPNLTATYGRLAQQSSFKQRRCQVNVSTLSSAHTKCLQSKGWKGNEEARATGTTRAYDHNRHALPISTRHSNHHHSKRSCLHCY